MTRGGDPGVIGEADLHGFVDNRLDAARHGEVQRRLKSSPRDGDRVANWREQNDLIRATFSDIVGESIPVSLNLAPPARLRCVTSQGEQPGPAVHPTRRPRQLAMIGSAALAIVVAGGIGTALIDAEAPSTVRDAGPNADGTLAALTLASLTSPASQTAASRQGVAHALPLRRIPDLGGAGYAFAGVTVAQREPTTLVFLYQRSGEDRLALGVARAGATDHADAAIHGTGPNSVTWRDGSRRMTLSGTIARARLMEIAAGLRPIAADEP